MNSKLQKKVPKEFILQLKTIDLLTYLQRFEPNTIIKNGAHYDSLIHDGLTIYRTRWSWKGRHLNGTTAIQYLVFVEDMSYIDGLYLLYQCYKRGLNNGKKLYQ